MVVNRRKKVGKYRGHSNHGGGMRKKRRGAGSRGGRGMAGTGKRAGQKKAGLPPMLGSRGFLARRNVAAIKTVNIDHFTPLAVEKLVHAGKATKEGNVVVIDLNVLGYGKLLGTGLIKTKVKFMVGTASAKAVEKVKAAGGDVVIASQ